MDDFPFDKLKCTVEIGSWAHSGLYVRPILMGGEGFSVGGSETAGESYAEFILGEVGAREVLYPPYPAAPEEDWPVVMYDITFSRSWQPYVRGYLILQIILNLSAFACFWMPPQCGERMGLAITSLLAAVTSDLVVSANLPAASELTWFARFSLTSLAFASLALFESAAVIYFFYLTSNDLVPKWAKWLIAKVKGWMKGRKEKKEEREREVERSIREADSGSGNFKNEEGDANGPEQLKDTWRENEGSRHARFEESHKRLQIEDDSPPNVRVEVGSSDDNFESLEIDTDKDAKTESVVSRPNGGPRKEEAPAPSARRKPSAVRASSRQPNKRLSQDKVFGHMNPVVEQTDPPPQKQQRPSRRSQLLRAHSLYPSRAGPQFDLQAWGSSQQSFARDADDYKTASEAKNNLRWQRVAKGIDDASRVIFPLAYAIAISVLLGEKEI
uniref:Neurotransmitter-gated ion-channel transmembrane domain-containing protein n=1 Tax=Pseudictyota dubia TaxID=2749911 RepID=A0A7R9WKC0_9STRA